MPAKWEYLAWTSTINTIHIRLHGGRHSWDTMKGLKDHNKLNNGKKGIRDQQRLQHRCQWAMPMISNIHPLLWGWQPAMWQNKCCKWMFSYTLLWMSVGTQWNTSTMKSSYKWTQDTGEQPQKSQDVLHVLWGPTKHDVSASEWVRVGGCV